VSDFPFDPKKVYPEKLRERITKKDGYVSLLRQRKKIFGEVRKTQAMRGFWRRNPIKNSKGKFFSELIFFLFLIRFFFF
jgi:hypothetical protein